MVYYINDIIIGANSKLELQKLVIQVLLLLKANDLYANLKKFKYNIPEINILGALILFGSIKMSLEKVKGTLE